MGSVPSFPSFPKMEKYKNLKLSVAPRVIEKFCKLHGLSLLAVFGSYARGDYRKDSDIDFLIRFKMKKSLVDTIEDELELSGVLNKKVQFIEEDTIPSELKSMIDKEKIVIYEER